MLEQVQARIIGVLNLFAGYQSMGASEPASGPWYLDVGEAPDELSNLMPGNVVVLEDRLFEFRRATMPGKDAHYYLVLKVSSYRQKSKFVRNLDGYMAMRLEALMQALRDRKYYIA